MRRHPPPRQLSPGLSQATSRPVKPGKDSDIPVDLEASGTPCSVYLRQTTTVDTAKDWRLFFDIAANDRLHIQSYNGGAGAYQDAVIVSQLGAVHALGGVAAGSSNPNQLFKVLRLNGNLAATGADAIGLPFANKTLAVIGSVYNNQTGLWECYDFLSANHATNYYNVTYTRAGGGDTLNINYGANVYNQPYEMFILYAP